MRTITVTLPMSAKHPLIGLRLKTPQGESHMAFSKLHKTAEIEVPDGVNEDEVEIIGGACDARGQWDEGVESVVLHAAKKAEPDDESNGQEAKGQGQGQEVTTVDPPNSEVTDHRRAKGRQPKNQEKPADKSAEASVETNADDKPAE